MSIVLNSHKIYYIDSSEDVGNGDLERMITSTCKLIVGKVDLERIIASECEVIGDGYLVSF